MSSAKIMLCLLVCFLICFKISDSAMTAADEQYYLDKHNEIRSKAKPTAANMKALKWDKDLAEFCQRMVNKCPDNYASGNEKNPDFSGSDILNAYGSDHSKTIVGLMDWVVYNFAKNSGPLEGCDIEKSACHTHSRMMWANYTKMGCASTICPQDRNIEIVCTYFPYSFGSFMSMKRANRAGNPYIKGTPCSMCEPISDCNQNLCTRRNNTLGPGGASGANTGGISGDYDDSDTGDNTAIVDKDYSILMIVLLVLALTLVF